MRIYFAKIEHSKFGRNQRSEKVACKTFKKAVRKVEKLLDKGESIESLEILADTD